MATKAEFKDHVRGVIRTLDGLAAEAAQVSDANPPARDEAAEFVREAIEDCQDAIRAIQA